MKIEEGAMHKSLAIFLLETVNVSEFHLRIVNMLHKWRIWIRLRVSVCVDVDCICSDIFIWMIYDPGWLVKHLCEMGCCQATWWLSLHHCTTAPLTHSPPLCHYHTLPLSRSPPLCLSTSITAALFTLFAIELHHQKKKPPSST